MQLARDAPFDHEQAVEAVGAAAPLAPLDLLGGEAAVTHHPTSLLLLLRLAWFRRQPDVVRDYLWKRVVEWEGEEYGKRRHTRPWISTRKLVVNLLISPLNDQLI